MLYSKHRKLEDRLLELLIEEPQTVKKLYLSLGEELSVGERAVYKAVDHLIGAGVLLKAGKRIRVNEEWLRDVRARLAPRELPVLAAGERISYSFTSIGHLDAFWKTMVLPLEGIEKDGQVFFYNPHNFWVYVPERRESEETYYAHFAKDKIHAFLTLGGETTADMEFKRAYQNDYFQIDTRPMPSMPRNVHITILGDYLITVRIPKRLAAAIDEIYASNRSADDITEQVRKAYKGAHMRFILERNPAKARKLRRSLSLNFYFKI